MEPSDRETVIGQPTASSFALQDKASLAQPGGKRLHPRITEPFFIRLGDKTCLIVNWSMGGFAVSSDHISMNVGDVVRAELRLTMPNDFLISFETPCQVVRQADHGLLGFRFLSLEKEQAALLYRVIEDHLSGQEVAINDLIGMSGLPPGLLPTPPRRHTTFGSLRRIGAVGMLLAAVVALSGLIASAALTVRSQVAAVAMNGSILRAPLTGLIQGSNFELGAIVVTGQILFRVGSPDEARQNAAASAQLRRQQLSLAEQRVRLGSLQNLVGNLTVFADANAESARARVLAIDTQITAQRTILGRIQSLFGQGVASQQQADLQQSQVQALQGLREQALAQLAAAKRDVELAKTGSLLTDLQDNTLTHDTMIVRIAEATEAVSAAEAALAALEQSAQVPSPCDCVIHAMAARPGDVIQAGSLVYSLRPKSGVPVVEALFAPDRTHEFAIGSRVSITLQDRVVIGRLLRIAYDEPQTGRLGLPPTASSEGRLAKVTIQPDIPLDPSTTGMPVAVSIRGNPLPGLLARVMALI